MKSKNVTVLVFRKFRIDGAIVEREVTKNILEVSKSENIKCSECREVVRHHNDHYEHFSKSGNVCSFKTK